MVVAKDFSLTVIVVEMDFAGLFKTARWESPLFTLISHWSMGANGSLLSNNHVYHRRRNPIKSSQVINKLASNHLSIFTIDVITH